MYSIILAFFVAILWGTVPIIYKINEISYHSIIIISAITFFVSSICYFLIYHKTIITDLNKHKNNIIYIVLTSFLGLFLANLFYYNAIKNSNKISIIVSITALYPLITLILSYLILNEKISFTNIIGIIFIVIGILCLIKK